MKKVLLMLALMIGAVTMMAQEDRDKSVGIETTTNIGVAISKIINAL